MKKRVIVGLIVLALLLDWAALDDITTGNEPSVIGEYLILLLSIPFIGFLLWRYPRKKT